MDDRRTVNGDQRTFVLVPGAFCGAWCWSAVARELIGAGHRVLSLTLPGLSYEIPQPRPGLGDAIDFIVAQVIDRGFREVTLVGHSWGGYPVTGAAHRLGDRVAHLVYYSAVVPRRGVATVDEDVHGGDAVREAIRSDADHVVVPWLGLVSDVLMPDASADLQAAVWGMMVPQPGGYMLDALAVDAMWDGRPKVSYVVGADDVHGALSRPASELAARAGTTPLTVAGGHMGLITHPRDVARAVLDAL